MNAKLSLHHIGGRAGTRAFPVLPAFEGDMVNVLYDADVDCLDQARARNRDLASELHVLPHCLGDRCGQATLHINYDPYTCSLLESQGAWKDAYCFYGDHDYVFSEVLRTMERRVVDVVTLDSLFRDPGAVDAPPPDFLSIDVQGAAFEVLEGGRGTLDENTVAILAECEFKRLYKDEKLAWSVIEQLEGRGFELIRWLELQSAPLWRVPVGLRGNGAVLAGELLFLRRPDSLDGRPPPQRRVMLRKLAFLALVFNEFEFTLECLRRCRELPRGEVEAGPRPAYDTFLDEFERTAAQMPDLYPPSFAQKYTFDLSRARFHTAPAAAAEPIARRGGGIREMVKVLTRPFPGARRALGEAYWRTRELFSPVVKDPPDSPVEGLLRRTGLSEQATVLKKNRLAQAPYGRGDTFRKGHS